MPPVRTLPHFWPCGTRASRCWMSALPANSPLPISPVPSTCPCSPMKSGPGSVRPMPAADVKAPSIWPWSWWAGIWPALLARARHLCGGKREVLLHCWRGGMRSDSMRWLLKRAASPCTGWRAATKSYRTFVRSELARPRPILVLGGYTGCGKTDILLELQRLGSQVIDLEGLARHKGSAFRALGQAEEQPGNEWFREPALRTVAALRSCPSCLA